MSQLCCVVFQIQRGIKINGAFFHLLNENYFYFNGNPLSYLFAVFAVNAILDVVSICNDLIQEMDESCVRGSWLKFNIKETTLEFLLFSLLHKDVILLILLTSLVDWIFGHICYVLSCILGERDRGRQLEQEGTGKKKKIN